MQSGERRVYPVVKTLTPAVGYVKKIEKDGITKVAGVKGLERYSGLCGVPPHIQWCKLPLASYSKVISVVKLSIEVSSSYFSDLNLLSIYL